MFSSNRTSSMTNNLRVFLLLSLSLGHYVGHTATSNRQDVVLRILHRPMPNWAPEKSSWQDYNFWRICKRMLRTMEEHERRGEGHVRHNGERGNGGISSAIRTIAIQLIHSTASSWQHPVDDIQLTTASLQHPVCNIQLTTFSLQYPGNIRTMLRRRCVAVRKRRFQKLFKCWCRARMYVNGAMYLT